MPEATILMGDMNFEPGMPEFDQMIDGTAPGYGHLSYRRGLLDTWLLAVHSENSGSTHPNANTQIDHCFVSAGLAESVAEVHVDDQSKGSDHWPVWTTFQAPAPQQT